MRWRVRFPKYINYMEQDKKGVLYLIPTIISEGTVNKVVAPAILDVVGNLDYYLVENLRTARRYISELNRTFDQLQLPKPIEEMRFVELSKDTDPKEVRKQLDLVVRGRSAGVISEAGCPGVADPGAVAVRYAHASGIKVVPLVGPSSILLALMASGFNGQSFVFHGYLPIDQKQRAEALKGLEREAQKKQQTQIFMETPYRNQRLLESILQVCHDQTLLCIARDLTGADEFVVTKSVRDWKRDKVNLHKVPVVFALSDG